MKLIHTADWHLGKRLNGFPLNREQREALERILDIVDRERPDAVVLAGDVFDTPVPPLSALENWAWFVTQLVGERAVPLVAISGNHDHPERLGVNASIARLGGLHILSDLATAHLPVTIAGVDIFGLPFHKPPHVRAALAAWDDRTDEHPAAASLDAANAVRPDAHTADDESVHDDDYDDAMARMVARISAARISAARMSAARMSAARISAARSHGAAATTSRPSVLVGHAFIAGSGDEPDGEDAIVVGGAGGVRAETLAGFDYVALGHIHGARACDPDGCVRYSGSIYPYSFSEAGRGKSVDVVEIDDSGVRVRQEPIEVARQVRVIDGKSFDQVMREARTETAPRRDDYVLIRVTDTDPIDQALARLREAYPNALLQQPAIEIRATAARLGGDARTIGVEEAFRAFYQYVYGEELSGLEEVLLQEIIAEDPADDRESR